MLPTFDIIAKMQDNTDYLSRYTVGGSSETINCYSQVHCVIWGVQGVQEGQGGLVNQLPGLPVRRQGGVNYRRKRQNFFFSFGIIKYNYIWNKESQLIKCNMDALAGPSLL